MRWNPIWMKELKTRARIVRIPILLMFYNAVVALIAILMLLASVDIFNGGSYIDYSGLMSLFASLGILQCGVGFLMALVMASSSISGERERGTLDLILVTPVSSRTLIGGKFLSVVTTAVLFAVSSMPVLAISSVYGGIRLADIGYLAGVFLMLVAFAGSGGLLCSCLVDRSSLSMMAAMILEIVLIIGPFVFLEGLSRFFYGQLQVGEAIPSLGLWVFVLAVDPLMPVIGFCDHLMGSQTLLDLFYYNYGIEIESPLFAFLQKHFLQCCLAAQIVLSLLFLWGAARKVENVKRKG